ncbi:MAG: VWA domain-containing protein [Acidobacteria bacterium]|nr:VWA domain-containing protein [Acidobacteriota bacterium]
MIILSPMKSDNKRPGLRALLALAALVCVAGGAWWTSAQEPPPPPEHRLRVEVGVVNLYCTVKSGKGALVTDLEQSEFEVSEDGKRQEVRYFARETDRPLTLGLLIDTSGSMRNVLPVEQETGAQFLRQVLRESDLALLMTFDVNVDLMQDFTSEPDRLEAALKRTRINAPVAAGPIPRNPAGTRLYDAVYLASRQKLAGEVGRKALIVISDGVDQGSDVKLKEAIEAAHRADTIVYAIGITDPAFYEFRGGYFDGRGILNELAKETGGRAIFPRGPEDLKEAFDQIAAELRSQYYLGYSPTNSARDGRFRKIEVKVKRGGLKVQARRGYYAASE